MQQGVLSGLEQLEIKHFKPLWYSVGLGITAIIEVWLDFYQLGQRGYPNIYYAATVRSMLTNWHNFFFASFDPAGFVTVDKPPLGFWVQTLSAKLFGFSPLSVLLPEAIAGVLSVLLLAHLVRRSFGPLAGLIAAFSLAVMPINVVTNRNNTIDSLLVLVTLFAAWAVIRAAETGRLRWLLVCAVLVGLGFNIKMLEAYLVVPAFGLLYLLMSPGRWRTRIVHLFLALLVLLAVSFAWLTAVDLTPASQRPYVGSSGTNSEFALAFNYNGAERFLGIGYGSANEYKVVLEAIAEMVGSGETGYPGVTRLLNMQLGGQVSWLLPLALSGIIALLWQPVQGSEDTAEEGRVYSEGTVKSVPLPSTQDTKDAKRARSCTRFAIPRDRYRQGGILWGIWLLTEVAFFSMAGFFHLYYMVMLTPALCALVGIGVATTLQDMVGTTGGAKRNWRGWLLPLVFVLTIATQVYLLTPFPTWSHWLSPLLIVLGVGTTIALVIMLLRSVVKRYIPPAVFVGMLVVLLTPTIWSAIPVAQNRLQSFPYAGPVLPATHVAQLLSKFGAGLLHVPPSWVSYLEVHQGKTPYLAATLVADLAAPLIVETGKPVMSIGGFSGSDSILGYQDVQQLVANGTIRYILMPAPYTQQRVSPDLEAYFEEASLITVEGFSGQGFTVDWIRNSCQQFDPVTGQHLAFNSPATGPVDVGQLALYDCQGAKS